MKRLSILLLFIFIFGCSNDPTEEAEIFQAGFKSIQFKDETRIYKPDSDSSDYLHYRPIDLDIWYPAKVASNDTTTSFQNILGLLAKRANYYTDSEVGNGLTELIAQSFTEALQCSTPEQLLNFKTESYKDANPVKSKFPLIIYMASYNGMCYENFMLFEKLASEGYVVASISSVGRYPGDMTMKNGDMLQQVDDALASVEILKTEANIDFSRIGIVGYSWGGLSGAVLASKMPGAACFISLDGSEFHHYGQTAGEDEDFEGIITSPYFETMSLTMPYLRLESNPDMTVVQKDSIYDFRQKLAGNPIIIKIDSANHEDFSCLPAVVNNSGNCETQDYYESINALTLAFLRDHLKNTKNFSEIQNELSNKVSMK